MHFLPDSFVIVQAQHVFCQFVTSLSSIVAYPITAVAEAARLRVRCDRDSHTHVVLGCQARLLETRAVR